jgi:anti-sigma B factor antagonist
VSGTPGIRIAVAPVDGATVLSVDGELDMATADRLVGAATEIPAGYEPLVLDLSRVSFLDSSGMRALLDVADTAAGAGRPVALLQPSVAVTRLLDLVDLRSSFPEIQDTEPSTLAALGR